MSEFLFGVYIGLSVGAFTGWLGAMIIFRR
jgi:hypothetical protein